MTQISTNFAEKTVSILGVPTDIGAGDRGGSMGPEALRVAGLEVALKSLGISTKDRGNLGGPSNPMRKRQKGLKHLPEVIEWNQNLKNWVSNCLDQNEFPLILGGDHSLAIGSISGVYEYCKRKNKKLVILWLDAHADFNTAETSPTGNIHGMPVAVLCGQGHPDLIQITGSKDGIHPHAWYQVGIRSVDAQEKILLNNSIIQVSDMRRVDEIGIKEVMNEILKPLSGSDIHLHVSFDVDFLDPGIAPGVATTVQGGPNYREAQLVMELIHDSGLMASLDVMELNPAFDNKNQTALLAVELIESLFGRQILALNPAGNPNFRSSL